MIEQKSSIRKELKGLKRALKEFESKVYSPELQTLSKKRLEYKNGVQMKFNDYWDYFSGMASAKGIDLSKYPDILKLSQAMTLEKEIDFKKAGLERDTLIELLTKKLPSAELEKLILKVLEFKQNHITPAEFCYSLSRFAQTAGLDSALYKNMILYARYVTAFENIDLIAIFEELESFENELKEKLFVNDDERTLSKLSRSVSVLSDLLDTSLNSKDYEFYLANRKDCEIGAIENVFGDLAVKYSVAFAAYADFEVLKKAIPSAERFYTLAKKRNQILLDNTLKRMKEENVHMRL